MELPNPDPADAAARPAHGGRDRHFCIGVASIAPLCDKLEAAGVAYTKSASGRPAVFFRCGGAARRRRRRRRPPATARGRARGGLQAGAQRPRWRANARALLARARAPRRDPDANVIECVEGVDPWR